MIFPIRTDRRLHHTPWMNYAIIGVNIAVYLLLMSDEELKRRFMLYPLHPRLYQFFTYQFLHADPMHIIGNMLFLYIFGNNVCDKMGNFGYLGFYLAGGVFAGITQILTSRGAALGASGSIAAVTGAYLVLLPYSRI